MDAGFFEQRLTMVAPTMAPKLHLRLELDAREIECMITQEHVRDGMRSKSRSRMTQILCVGAWSKNGRACRREPATSREQDELRS